MTLFRKNYKEAMNDIKPDAAFVESVIAASKKRRPPLRARYAKYAAAAAAAVVVVSGTVLSMPLWNKVEQSNDGVISETTAMETAVPEQAAEPLPMSNANVPADEKNEATQAPKAETKTNSNQTLATTKPSKSDTPKADAENVSGQSRKKAETKNVPVQSQAEPQQAEEQTPQQTESSTMQNEAAETADNRENTVAESIVKGDTDAEVRENTMPADMAPYGKQAEITSASSASQPEITDTDIPTPSGYRCVSATPRGYTFVNDEGAVITVTINYGGEERAPYIEENGDNIYAVFTSFGLSVTINASGADRECVEEIINSLR